MNTPTPERLLTAADFAPDDEPVDAITVPVVGSECADLDSELSVADLDGHDGYGSIVREADGADPADVERAIATYHAAMRRES